MVQVLNFLVERGYTIDKYGIVRGPEGNIINGAKSDGYLKFSVRTDFTSSYAMRFHKFQAFVKYGDEMFKKGNVVRHLNGIKDDNSYDNIVIGSQSENMLDRSLEDRKNHVKNKVGIPEEIREEILKDRQTLSLRGLSQKYNIAKSTISDFLKRNESSR